MQLVLYITAQHAPVFALILYSYECSLQSLS